MVIEINIIKTTSIINVDNALTSGVIPVLINEDKLFIYNPSSEFYNDLCFTYTTESGTDIILKDRRNNYIYRNNWINFSRFLNL